MYLLESLPMELLEEMLSNQREILDKQLEWCNPEAEKTLLLIDIIKIEIEIRSLEEELGGIGNDNNNNWRWASS